MKFLINKVKYIALVLTLINLCLGIFGLYEGISKFLIGGVFIAVELAVLVMYLIMVTHNWTNDQTERVNKEYKQGAEKLAKRLSILESSLSEVKYWADGELKKNSLGASLRFESMERITKDSFAELSNEISEVGINLKLSLNKLNSGTVKTHQEITDSLEKTKSGINQDQEKIIKSLREINSEVVKGQEEIRQEIAEKYLAHEELFNSISSTTLDNQQDLNKTLEANSQKTTQLSSRILNHIDSKTNNINFNVAKQLNITYDRIDALMSIHNIIELNAPLPIMHDWRVSSDYAHATLSSLIEKGEGSVIDVGSGITSLLFGYGVKKNGSGKVIALEHSKEYFEKSKAMIKLHQLEDYCELYYCPLKEYDLNGKKWLWYDIANVDFPDNITLISVDGPPGGTQYMARYPVIPIMEKYLNKNTLIYLDDSNREEEKLSVEKWVREFSLKNDFFKSDRGYFVLSK